MIVETVTIGHVGAEGDGIASADDGAALYVPNTLPGEIVQVERDRRQGGGWVARSVAIERASEARFETCGYLAPRTGAEVYARALRDVILPGFEQLGIDLAPSRAYLSDRGWA